MQFFNDFPDLMFMLIQLNPVLQKVHIYRVCINDVISLYFIEFKGKLCVVHITHFNSITPRVNYKDM